MKTHLVTATGRPMYLTIHEDSFEVFQRADYVVALDWDDEGERVMYLHNAFRDDGRCWGLCDSMLGALLDEKGLFVTNPDPTPIFIRGVGLVLNREASPNEIARCKDVILFAYERLHRMPPRPLYLARKNKPAPMFEVTHKQGERVIGQAEV